MSKTSRIVYTPPVVSDNSKPEIKAVIFDLGGVVIDWNNDIIYSYIAERFGFEFEEVKKKVKALGPSLCKGLIDEREFWTRIFDSYNMPLPDDWKDLWLKKLREKARLDKGVAAIIQTLKKNGYRLAMITNTEPSHDEWSEEIGWYNPFEVVVVSYKEKMRKPEREIYDLALQRIGLKGSECIFIDNKQEHVDGAKAAGINAILFKNAEQLKEELKGYGVRC